MAIDRAIAQTILETQRAVRRAGELVTFTDDAFVTVAHGYVVPVDGGDAERPRDATDVGVATVRLKFVPRMNGGDSPDRGALVMYDGTRRRVINRDVVRKAGRFSHALVDVTA